MPRYAQLVMGPAGSGKSTFCNAIQKHAETIRRTVHVVNLDPAAEHFEYQLLADIRDLISLDDAMEDESLRFGPNGGLVFCMEYLVQNFDWLGEQLDEIEDDYIIFDLPGQIELYTHLPVMRQLVDQLKHWNFNICGVFLIEAQFMIEPSKFVSGVMATLSTMVGLETPHISVLTKLDLLNTKAKKELDRFLEPDMNLLLAEEMEETRFGKKFNELNQAIASMIDDYSLVNFLPLDITEEESVQNILIQIDMAMQYGEDMEHREAKEYDQDDDGQADLGAMGFDNT